MALVGAPLSLARYPETGFQPVYVVHLLCTIAIVVTYLKRHSLPETAPVILAVGVFSLIALAGLYNYGLLSIFPVYVNLAALIITVAYSIRLALIYTLACALVSFGFACAYTRGWLIYPADLNLYAISFQSWQLIIVSGAIASLLVLTGVNQLQRRLKETIEELNLAKNNAEYFANYDYLTGIATRKLASDRLQNYLDISERNQSSLAIIFVDLDNFKTINDNNGHEAGDAVLIESARRFSRTVRKGDTVCRIGGDEFLILMPGSDKPERLRNFCDRLIAELEQPIYNGKARFQVGASLGIAMYPQDGKTASDLIKAADNAMYQVKQGGKGSYLFASHPDAGPAADEETDTDIPDRNPA